MNGLRRLRERKFMTQGELAAAVGISRQATISKWEAGDDRPRPRHLKALCTALDVTADELLAALDRQDTAQDVALNAPTVTSAD